MIPRRFKYNPRQDRDFFQSAKRKFSHSFSFYFKSNDSGLKTTVVVPKKTALMATERNEIKRRIYNLILPILEERSSLPFSVVIVVNKSSKKSPDPWKKELEDLFFQLPQS